MTNRIIWKTILTGACAVSVPATTSAEILPYYIAADSRDTIHFGQFQGLPNPNQGRLTFLFSHDSDENPMTNHFHGIGVHTYTGDPETPLLTETNGNNRIPEGYTGQAPLTLLPGDGPFAGLLISKANEQEYSDLTIGNVNTLAGFGEGAPETYLYNSSAGGYQTPLDGAVIVLELVNATPGLHVAIGDNATALAKAGDVYELGPAESLPVTPVFWVDADAPMGVYSAALRLHDVGTADGRTPFGESGTFYLDFAVIPEPASVALLSLGALVTARRRRR